MSRSPLFVWLLLVTRACVREPDVESCKDGACGDTGSDTEPPRDSGVTHDTDDTGETGTGPDDTADPDTGPECDTAAPKSDAAVCADACGLDVEDVPDVLRGENERDWAGYALAAVPGGGIIVGAPVSTPDSPGAAYVWWGPVAGDHSLVEATTILRSERGGDSFGQSVAAVGSDGSVAVAGDYALEVYERDQDVPFLTFSTDPDEHRWCCRGLTSGDFSGDGIPDLAFMGPDYDYDHRVGGWVAILDGTRSGEVGEADVDANINLERTEAWGLDAFLGYEVRAVGDLDGDGFDELAVPGNGVIPSEDYRGEATFLLRGPIEGATSLLDAAAVLPSPGAVLPAGDFDQDGRGDLLVNLREADYSERRVSAVSMQVDGTVDSDSALATFSADAPLALAGNEGSSPPGFTGNLDIDGDGWQDLVLSAGCDTEDFGGPIQFVVLRGPASGNVTYDPERDPHLHGDVGTWRLGGVDLDDDGQFELALGRIDVEERTGGVSVISWDMLQGIVTWEARRAD